MADNEKDQPTEEGGAGTTSSRLVTDEPPPSYDSIYGKLKHAKATSASNAEFAKTVATTDWCGTVGSVISIIISILVPIACIAIGAHYLKQCPAERMIPIFLIVAGSFGLLRGLMAIVFLAKKPKQGDEESQASGGTKAQNPCEGMIGCFLICWFIAGSVWVYSIRNSIQHDDPSVDGFCQVVVYTFAFWFITINYILMAIALFTCCFCCCLACCAASTSEK